MVLPDVAGLDGIAAHAMVVEVEVGADLQGDEVVGADDRNPFECLTALEQLTVEFVVDQDGGEAREVVDDG